MKVFKMLSLIVRDVRTYRAQSKEEKVAAQWKAAVTDSRLEARLRAKQARRRAKMLKKSCAAIAKNPEQTRWSALDRASLKTWTLAVASRGRPFVDRGKIVRIVEVNGDARLFAASGFGGERQCVPDTYSGLPTLRDSVAAVTARSYLAAKEAERGEMGSLIRHMLVSRPVKQNQKQKPVPTSQPLDEQAVNDLTTKVNDLVSEIETKKEGVTQDAPR